MTTVNLGAVFLNAANDLVDVQSFQNTIGLVATKSRDGEIRALANGRLRLVLRATTARSFNLRFELCTRTQVTWLEDHVAQVLCARDDRGRKVYGAYLSVPVTENVARSDYADIDIVFTEVTHSEVV